MPALMRWRGGERCGRGAWMPDLTATLRAALPPGVALGQGRDAPLWPGEDLPGAVTGRLAEFARGRNAARAALRGLGLAPQAIPMQADRSPLWPVGVTGSISHCAGACLAIAGLRAEFAGLGLDIEPAAAIEPRLWPVILRPEEMGLDPLAVFVAKEAAYKAQYGVTGVLFDFHTLSVAIRGDQFAATFQQPIGAFAVGDALEGRLMRSDAHTAAVCVIAA